MSAKISFSLKFLAAALPAVLCAPSQAEAAVGAMGAVAAQSALYVSNAAAGSINITAAAAFN